MVGEGEENILIFQNRMGLSEGEGSRRSWRSQPMVSGLGVGVGDKGRRCASVGMPRQEVATARQLAEFLTG